MRNNGSARSSVATTTIAVDLGAIAVRVAEVEAVNGGSVRVVRRGAAPLPQGAWNDLVANRDVFSAAVTQALSAAGIAGRSVVACFPRRLVTLRFVRLPHAPPEQMRGMVEFEAQQYVLFPLEEVILDYHVVTNPLDASGLASDDMDTVLLAAARRELIDALMQIFDRAGLELLQLSVSALALAENARDSLETTALIDVEPGEMDVAVVADGQLLFTRSSALDVVGVRPEVAERREVEEVVRSFTAYQNEFRSRPLAHVYIGGESASGLAGEGLQQALSEMLEMPVAPLVPRGVSGGDMEARAWATAIGMALQARVGSLAPINLVPNERAMRKAQQAKSRRQQVLALGGVAATVLLVMFGSRALSEAQKYTRDTAQANRDLQDLSDRYNKRKKDYDKVKAVSDEVTSGLDRNHPAVDVLFALNSALPTSADIWLTQFQFERGNLLTIHGDTKKAIAATQLVLALQKSGAFTNVVLTYVGDSQDTTPVANPVPAPTPAMPAPATASTTAPGSGGTNAAPNVPALPASSSFGGFPGRPGGAGSNPGAGGQRGPTVFTPTGGPGTSPGGAPMTPPGPTFSPGRGGPGNGGGVPTFTPGSTPLNVTPTTPTAVPSAPSAPPVILEQLTPRSSRNEEKSASGESRGRLATLEEGAGHLVLAGWQASDPSAGDPSGGGNGGRRRRNRQQGGGNFPNGYPGGNPALTPGATPGGTAPPATSSAPTYSTGSIFGAAPTNPLPSTGQGNPGGQGGGFRRRFGAGGFGGGGFGGSVGGGPPVPSVSGTVTRTVPRKPVAPPRPKTNSPKQTLTSFVITCRINMKRADLVPAGTQMPKPTTASQDTAKHAAPNPRRAVNTNSSVDNGSDDADTQ